jgi:hypothetical protein
MRIIGLVHYLRGWRVIGIDWSRYACYSCMCVCNTPSLTSTPAVRSAGAQRGAISVAQARHENHVSAQ